MTASGSANQVLERVKIREVAGGFGSRETLEIAVDALLTSGFDRADIAVVPVARGPADSDNETASPAPKISDRVRQAFIAREDLVLVLSLMVSIIVFAGAAVAAWVVVRLAENLVWAGLAAVLGAVAAAVFGIQAARGFARKRARSIAAQFRMGELVALVRVWSPDQEATARHMLTRHGARAVCTRESEIEKRLEHIPLQSLRIDPWLGDEPLGQI
jgi:hypothetical protein